MCIVRQRQLGKEYMFNKIALLLIIGCISSSSYAATLEDCDKKVYELSDLKELKKSELISDYCECKGLTKMYLEFAKDAQEKGFLDLSMKNLNKTDIPMDNSKRIKRILENNHKYKEVISCPNT